MTFSRIPFILLFFTCFEVAAAPLQDIPGTVPLNFERQAASDLVFEGRTLQPDEARHLVASGKIKSLSFLDPIADSIIWSPQIQDTTQIDDYAALELKASNDEVEFIEADSAPSGRVIFLAQKKMADGQIRAYRFLLDEKGHNMLARKTLLRKLGYRVPPMEHIQSLRVKFSGAFSKREFIKDKIKKRIFKDPTRWIAAGEDTEDEFLTFQDLIALDQTRDHYYNLARGNVDSGIVQGRRVIQSLLIPFSLTDAPESLELFSWTGAHVFNQQVIFPYEYPEDFRPSLDDAIWMARRILKLSVVDWREIGKSARMPLEPEAKFTEQLISRRNYLREVLGLASESTELPVQTKISLGERLVEGKLKGGRNWPGYARRFAGIEPESPLSLSEVWGLVRSKFLSNVISNTIGEFNTRYMPRTDLGWKIFDHQLDVAAAQFAEFVKTGKVTKTPLGFWKTTYFNTDLIASREVITGSYLGTDNMIQIADSLGFAIDGGNFYLGEGLPDKVIASARARVRLLVTYTHIKPVQSIRASLQEPMKNILVPYLKHTAKQPLEKILELEQKFKNKELVGDALKEEIKKHIEEWAKTLGVGESYVINTSLAPGFDLSVGKGISKDLQAFVKLQNSLVGVARMHILRRDENTVQVYSDNAGYNDFAIGLTLQAMIPLVELGLRWPKGAATTQFFNFNIDGDLERNPKFFDEVTGVLGALNGAEPSFLKEIKAPWHFQHGFSDVRKTADILVWKNSWTTTTNKLKVTEPELGQMADYLRRTKGERYGVEYEGLLLDVTNALIAEKYPDKNIRINTTRSGNPADTVFGKALTRQVVFDARVRSEQINLDDQFAAITYRWKGWKMKTAGIDQIMNEIDQMFGAKLFKRPDLKDSEEIQLYNIEIQSLLYRRAFEHILKLNAQQVHDIFRRHAKTWPNQSTETGDTGNQTHPWATWIIGDLKDLRRAYAANDNYDFADEMVEVIEVAESQLEFAGFQEFIGGMRNMFVTGTLRGFRVGAENGQENIRPITLGEVGDFNTFGPIHKLQSETKVVPGELLLHWLVNPL